MDRVYKIDSTEVLVSQDWACEKKLNARAVFDVTVIDLLTLSEINIGDSFVIEVDTVINFAGIVKDIEEFEEENGTLYYQLAITNNSAIADKRIVGETYENELAGDIFKDIRTNILATENVTVGTIQDGPSISKAIFNYIKVSDAFNRIKDLTGLVWEIDNDLKLNFYDRATNSAAFSIMDSSVVDDFRRRKTMSKYRNVQYARGGSGRTDTQTDVVPTPKPDGESRNFIVPYPLAEKPTITINSTPITSTDIGVRGFDTAKKWYFSYDSEIITQDSGETVLTDSDTITITFVGLFPLFVEARDEGEITARATAEGNSGIYEMLDTERSLDTIQSTGDYANGILRKYGEVADKITYSTYTAGLEPGQLQHITRSLFEIDDDFLIESVVLEPDGEELIYHITALDGATIGGWEVFFKDILKPGEDYVISGNEVLIKLQAMTDNIILGDTVTATAAAPESRVGTAIVGFSEVA